MRGFRGIGFPFTGCSDTNAALRGSDGIFSGDYMEREIHGSDQGGVPLGIRNEDEVTGRIEIPQNSGGRSRK